MRGAVQDDFPYSTGEARQEHALLQHRSAHIMLYAPVALLASEIQIRIHPGRSIHPQVGCLLI